MTKTEQLLEAVYADPENLNLQLMYADWMEDEGLEGSEMLRAMVEKGQSCVPILKMPDFWPILRKDDVTKEWEAFRVGSKKRA